MQFILLCAVMSCFVDFVIGSCTDHYDQHFCFCADEFVNDTNTGTLEFDFQKSRQVVTLFVSQRLPITTFTYRQRILKNLVDCFDYQ